MKFRPMWIVSLVMLMCGTAPAQTDWVSRFLSRYTPSKPVQSAPLDFTTLLSPLNTTQNGATPLTTGDVVRLLLENNRDLTVARGVPLSSFYSIASLYRPFQLNFHATGNVNNSRTPSSNLLQGAVDLVQLQHSFTVGFDQALQTGTIYTFNYQVIRNSTNSVFEVFNPAYNGTVQYGITQHVLRDFGRAVNSTQIRIARNNEKISELDFELQIIELVTQALNQYWDLVFAAEDVKVKQRSLDLATKTLHDNQIQVDVGTLAPLDLIQAQAEVATRQDDLITAQGGDDRRQDELKKLISSGTDPGFAVARLSLIEPVRQPGVEQLLPLSQAIQFALENRKEMKQSGYDIDNQDITIQYARNQLRPVLDLTAGYSHAGLGGTRIPRTLSDGGVVPTGPPIPGGIGDMFNELYSFRFPGYSAGFNLQIPIKNRAGKGDYDRAINERDLAVKRKAATAQRIALDVRNAYTQLDMDRARVETACRARELTKLKLDAEQKKFELGTSTVRFVLEEQRNLAQAETNEIQALVNYAKAVVAYEHAIGNTLARNNIEVEKQLPLPLAPGQSGEARAFGAAAPPQ